MSLDDTINSVANYLAVMCGIRLMAPQSVKDVYLPGIAASFDIGGNTNMFRAAIRSPIIKLMFRGFERSYNKRKPKSDDHKVAFGTDLALASKDIMIRNAGPQSYYDCEPSSPRADRIRERMFLVMVVGISFLLRCSEHNKSKATTSASPVTRNNFIFWRADGTRIPYNRIGLDVAETVMISVKFSKADQSGYGRRVTHRRQAEYPEVCVVNLLQRWIRITRDTYGATADMDIYVVPSFANVRLEDLHRLMHATVLHKLQQTAGAGEVPSHLIKATSHSLRYGGATMMAAAGYPQYMIAMYGGWSEKSRALQIYTKTSDEMVNRVSRHMAMLANENPSMQLLRELYAKGG